MFETYAVGLSTVILLSLFAVWQNKTILNVAIKLVILAAGLMDLVVWLKRLGVV